MNKKTYKLANKKKFQVEFGFKGGKWSFRIGNYTLMTRVPGGKVNAEKIAEILRKSWFRHGKVDGVAQNAIDRITKSDFKRLKDYRGPFDHNWSWSDSPNHGEPTMVPENLPVVEAEPEVVPVTAEPVAA